MPHGESKFVLQMGGRGLFGAIALTVELGTAPQEIDYGSVPRDWHDAISFGVQCTAKLLSATNDTQPIKVRVMSLQDFPTDTSFDLVAFITIQAIYKAFERTLPPEVYFDGRSFHFPLKRPDYGITIPEPSY